MKIRVLNTDPIYDYRQACKITEGLDLDVIESPVWFEVNKRWQPKDATKWWIKQIIANHSTLRCVKFRIIDERPKTVIMQIIRATKGHPQPEVQSSRPDWNDGKERSLDPYEEKLFCIDHTAESFVEMAKQRLCNRTEERTRKFMEEAVATLKKSSDPFLRAVGYCCHPYCWWYDHCPEIRSCGKKDPLSATVIRAYEEDCK